MLKVKVKISELPQGVRDLSEALENPTELNKALGVRLEDELIEYFDRRNFEPNKRGWKRSFWWADVARGTADNKGTYVSGANDQGAEVTIDAIGFAIRVYGGTIRPRNAKALTIPLVEDAYGRRASEFPGELFRPRGTNVLAREDNSESGFEPVYALLKKVERKADTKALPPTEELEKTLANEASEYLKRNFNN